MKTTNPPKKLYIESEHKRKSCFSLDLPRLVFLFGPSYRRFLGQLAKAWAKELQSEHFLGSCGQDLEKWLISLQISQTRDIHDLETKTLQISPKSNWIFTVSRSGFFGSMIVKTSVTSIFVLFAVEECRNLGWPIRPAIHFKPSSLENWKRTFLSSIQYGCRGEFWLDRNYPRFPFVYKYKLTFYLPKLLGDNSFSSHHIGNTKQERKSFHLSTNIVE